MAHIYTLNSSQVTGIFFVCGMIYLALLVAYSKQVYPDNTNLQSQKNAYQNGQQYYMRAMAEEQRNQQSYIGSIDQGTTSSRFVIFDRRGKPIASHQEVFKQIYPHSG
jgi:hypothetical protein